MPAPNPTCVPKRKALPLFSTDPVGLLVTFISGVATLPNLAKALAPCATLDSGPTAGINELVINLAI